MQVLVFAMGISHEKIKEKSRLYYKNIEEDGILMP